MKKHYRTETDCLNCGAELQGKFCHVCGQENLQIKESFGHMMNHAISDYFHFDHQFFHTLKPLLFEPGKLTNEYMAGRRVQYLHPIKMYIFISLVYFVLLFQSGYEPPVKVNRHKDKAGRKKELAATDKKLDSVMKNGRVPGFAKSAIAIAKKNIDSAAKKNTAHKDESGDDDADIDNMIGKGKLPGMTHDSTYAQYLISQSKLPENKRDGFIDRLYNKKAFMYKEKYGTHAKEAFFEEFKHNMPKLMFLMLPLCALILKLSFRKNRKYYVEHLIFTFHLHCFLFLFLAIIMVLELIIPKNWGLHSWFDLAATIGVIWYLYRSLKVFYQRSKWRTISKLIGATFMYFIVFTFSLSIGFILTAITM
ncbi:MAG: hypothetical protein JWQ34_1205 [Mucilaginibacter sp.]|uniref:DUF3667 domain-containing protein n=1 Tax=Mucilaginibacter sp. TaxID=1882438 RepID=UPI00262E4C2E|nr:DUF3667 domain-containing protein [Mucilaginibacter sp.]MDB5002980.1 hypothetical protein [Mucilaginibacter sp.]